MMTRMLQNPNAYLLFYRRRTTHPLGGKTSEKIEEARLKPPKMGSSPEPIAIDTLPTPPNEKTYIEDGMSGLAALENQNMGMLRPSGSEGWPTPRSNLSNPGSSSSSPPRLDEIELPSFEDSHYEDPASFDPLATASQQFDFPDPSSKASVTSSDEVEPDLDGNWREQQFEGGLSHQEGRFDVNFSSSWSKQASPARSNASDTDPFSDANVQKGVDHTTDPNDIPIQTDGN